ncbi:MAG: MFS transporter [Dehalococcoidia bacterium]
MVSTTAIVAGAARRLPVHYGWVVVALGILSNTVSGGALFWAVSLYIPTVSEDMGVGRTPVVAVFVIGQTIYAFAGPFAGRFIDRQGARAAILIGAVVTPVAFIATSMSDALWQLAIGWSVIGLARAMIMPVPFNWLITRWFEGRRRQAALGVSTVGFGLGGAVMLPLLARLVEVGSWPLAMVASGIALGVVQAIAGLLVVDRPRDAGLRPVVSADEERDADAGPLEEWGFTTSQALRSPAFWLMSFAILLFFLGQASVITLALDFFDSRGLVAGASILGASALFSTLARLPLGLGLARVRNVYRLVILVACGQAIAVTALVISTSLPGIVFWVVLWGTGSAFAPMIEPLLTSRAFGVRHFGALSGIVALLSLTGQNLGAIGGAALFDLTGSYTVPFSLYAGGFAVCAGLLVLFTRALATPGHRARAAAQGAEG